MERVNGAIATSQRLRSDLVQVSVGDAVVGFVEQAGPVHVALHGPRYDRAVEVSQSLVFDVAVADLLAHVRTVDRITAELAQPEVLPETGSRGSSPSRVA